MAVGFVTVSMSYVIIACQVIVGLGILNVWFLRANRSTEFRGREAKSLKEEFSTYGLPEWMFWLVGTLKVGAALALLAGLIVPSLIKPAAAVMVVLMLGAVAMHLKVKDPVKKSLPAAGVLALSLAILVLG